VRTGDIEIDVLKFPFYAKFDGVTDDTLALQNAFNAANAAAAAKKGTIVRMPPGTGMFSKLIAPEKITIRGAGKNATTLQVISGGTARAAIEVAAGYSDNLFFEDFKLRGAGALNPGQHGLLADALGDGKTPDTGGWGNGGARRIEVSNFTGAQCWLRGKGNTAAFHQHQFLVFEHCDFSARDLADSMRISGKNGQVTFINSQFSYGGGSSTQAGTNLRILREVGDDGSTVVADSYAYAIDFYNCSIEGRANGVVIDTAQTVNFYGPFFERLGKALTVGAAAKNINLYSPHFANAGVAGDGTGYLVKASVPVNLYSPHIAGTADKSFVDLVRVIDGAGEQVAGVLSSGQSTDSTPVAGVLDIKSATTAFSRGSIVSIATRNHFVGAVIHLVATGSDIILANTGNIGLSGKAAPLTVPVNSMVTLARFDGAKDWRLVAVSA
jgi:hypothetical protein